MKHLKSISLPVIALTLLSVFSSCGTQSEASSSSLQSAKRHLTKRDILTIAALEVIKEGNPRHVEGCDEVPENQLLSCVYDATNMESDIVHLPETAKIKGIVELGYYDGSGDCALNVRIDGRTGIVKSVSEWNCI